MIEALRPGGPAMASAVIDLALASIAKPGAFAATSGAGAPAVSASHAPAGLQAIHSPAAAASSSSSAAAPGADTPGRSPVGAPPLDASAPADARHGRAAAEVRRLLSSVAVEDLGGGRSQRGRVAVVELSHSVEEALALLTAHSVLSGPVLDRAAAGGRGRFVAVLHIADVFSAMVEMMQRRHARVVAAAPGPGSGAVAVGAEGLKHSPLAGGRGGHLTAGDAPGKLAGTGARRPLSRGTHDSHLRAAIAHKRRLMRLTVKDVLEMTSATTAPAPAAAGDSTPAPGGASGGVVVGATESVMTIATSEGGEGEEDSTDDGASGTGRLRLSRSTFRQLPAGCPAVYAAHVLAAGAHAVPIVDLDGAIVRVVTQADVVRFLAANMDAVPAAHGLSLGDLGLDTSGRARLVVAKFDERVMDVFQRMRHSNSGAVPVVDSTGCMTANLSMTDAKAVAKQASIRLLELPVSAFLTEISTATDIKSPSIYCRPTDTLSSCITTLAATRIHQVYFVDEAARPTAVLRVSDVLRTLLGEEA